MLYHRSVVTFCMPDVHVRHCFGRDVISMNFYKDVVLLLVSFVAGVILTAAD